MSELLTVPRTLIGTRQLCPDATLMSPVEFSPQSASPINIGQSEAASAGDTDIEPVAPTTSAKMATLDNRMVDVLAFIQNAGWSFTEVATPVLPKSWPGVQSSLRPFPYPGGSPIPAASGTRVRRRRCWGRADP